MVGSVCHSVWRRHHGGGFSLTTSLDSFHSLSFFCGVIFNHTHIGGSSSLLFFLVQKKCCDVYTVKRRYPPPPLPLTGGVSKPTVSKVYTHTHTVTVISVERKESGAEHVHLRTVYRSMKWSGVGLIVDVEAR